MGRRGLGGGAGGAGAMPSGLGSRRRKRSE